MIGTPPAYVGRNVSFNFAFTLTGVPAPTTSVTSGSLPPGLTLSVDGVLSGTPTTEGSYTATVTATNGIAPDATKTFTIAVYLFSVTPSSGPKGTYVNLRAAELPPGETVKFFYKTGLTSPTKVKLCQQVAGDSGTAACLSSVVVHVGMVGPRIPGGGNQGPKGPHTIVAKSFPSLVKHKTTFILTKT